jgi:uncharacterized damage-inducible protein DinB
MSTLESAAAPSLGQTALGDLSNELASTRRLLERVPEEHFAWKPHEKSSSLGALATHVATISRLGLWVLQNDEIDVMNRPPTPPAPTTRDELLAQFDETSTALKDALRDADEGALLQPWTFRRGDQVMFKQPRVVMLRGFVLSHLIHHRGQLTVYLRLLDVPLPPLYGPTADENPFA